MTETKIEHIELGKIKASKTQPRKYFDQQKLNELADSVRAQGIIQPLLVRPDWCMGKDSDQISEIGGHNGKAGSAPAAMFYELVAGERRYRAAGMAKMDSAPAIIRLLGDQETLELQLIENLQRDDLDPFEEAEGYQHLLDLRDGHGKAIHTVETIHRRVHKPRQRIYYRLKLLRVSEAVRAAVQRDGLSAEIAEMIGGIPTADLRDAAAEEILHPLREEGPLSRQKTRDLIADKYMRSLAGAPFALTDAQLVPPIVDDEIGERIGGGACTDCPMRTGNMEAIIGKTKRPDVCTNPRCYMLKCDAQFAQTQKSAVAEGKKILSASEVSEIFETDPDEPHFGHLYFDSKYVILAQSPERDQVAMDAPSKLPTWKKLLKNVESKPQIVVARDPRGRTVELVDRELAIEAVNLAAKQRGETSLFQRSETGGQGAGASSAAAKENAAKREKAKKELAANLEGMTCLIDAIDKQMGVLFSGKVSKDHKIPALLDLMIELSITHASHDGCWLICKRLGLDPKAENGHTNREGVEGAALEYGLTLPSPELKIGFLVELLVAQRVKWWGVVYPGFEKLFALYGIDLKALGKAPKVESRTAKVEKPKVPQQAKKEPKAPAPLSADYISKHRAIGDLGKSPGTKSTKATKVKKCNRCSKDVEPGKAMCAEHLEWNRKRLKKLRRKGAAK